MRPSFRLGVEEEYLIVDQESMDLVREPAPAFILKCQDEAGNRVTNEYLQCQLEVGTRPSNTVSECAVDLGGLRALVSKVASEYGYSIIATSTHNFASWRRQTRTPKDRYNALNTEIGQSASRMLICGMHIHIEIEDEELRIDLMNQATYFLPHMLALSCSSPFWEGDDTGLASYRIAVFDALPRTGIPDRLESYSNYRKLLNQLVDTGCIEDATKLWWDMRPSAKFPTLEQRITDICSKLEDTVALVAVYQSIIAYLYRLRTLNQRWRIYPATLIAENRWRAQRYGCEDCLLDLGKTQLVPFKELAYELVDLCHDDAVKLGCDKELSHIKTIVKRGTSSRRQRKVFYDALEQGATRKEANILVVRHLVREFLDFQS